MGRYLLYVDLPEDGGDGTTELDTVEECVEAVSQLVRNTFESGRRLVTFSVGDMEATLQEPSAEEREGTDAQS